MDLVAIFLVIAATIIGWGGFFYLVMKLTDDSKPSSRTKTVKASAETSPTRHEQKRKMSFVSLFGMILMIAVTSGIYRACSKRSDQERFAQEAYLDKTQPNWRMIGYIQYSENGRPRRQIVVKIHEKKPGYIRFTNNFNQVIEHSGQYTFTYGKL